MRKRYLSLFIITWTSLILLSFLLNFYLTKTNTVKIVSNKAESFFNEIITTRLWNSTHGGVYVPITEETQPNLYLMDPKRDIVTVDGQKLTKINPAYMTRQIAEIAKEKNEINYHITSLNPIRPANKADDWESKTLEQFELERNSVLEKVSYDSLSYYRYMAPLITEQSCLLCHENQGYKLGDIRGGISVSFSSKVYEESEYKQIAALSIIHLLVFTLGIFAVLFYYKTSNNYLSILHNKNKELEDDHLKQEQLNVELIESNSTKDELLSIIGHDLRSPLNSIIGFSNLLKQKIENKDYDKIKLYNDYIWNGSLQTNQLIENLLYWANSQKNAIKFLPEKINLNNITTEIINAFNPIAALKSISLNAMPIDDIFIIADLNMIRIILRNLINNAIKYTEKNGAISIKATIKKDFVEISVKDSGIGIPSNIAKSLFISDKKASRIGTENETGTGLGLPLCKQFVEKQGGKIWLDKENQKGSEFIFTIPLA